MQTLMCGDRKKMSDCCQCRVEVIEMKGRNNKSAQRNF